MNAMRSVRQRLQHLEVLLPRRLRLPFRYHAQKFSRGLEPEMHLLPRLVTPGDIAIDIGANRGIYAYALARLAATVHCFEPIAACCHYVEAAKLPGVSVHNCALSDSPGVVELHVPLNWGAPVWTRGSLTRPEGPALSVDVEVRTLDSFDFEKIDFMKIDVEGSEAAVLRGACDTLRRSYPTLLVEIDYARHSRESFESLIGWLRTRGYLPNVLYNRQLRRTDDAWADARYHCNFIFPRPRKG